jgi:hypothetical protein
MPDRDTLMVGPDGTNASDPDFLLEEELPFNDQTLLDYRHYDCVALLADARHAVDLSANRDAADLCFLICEFSGDRF